MPEEDWVQQMGEAVQEALAGGAPQPMQPVARLRSRDVRTRPEGLRRLVRAGLVQEGRSPEEPVVVDRLALAELVEELRLVTEHEQPDPSATRTSPSPPAGSWLNGPKLIAVNGNNEGTIFALEGPRGSWVVGRGQGADVTLPDDPYVSRQGAEVWQEGGDFFIEDLQPSKNGTYVNWRRLDRREAAHLQDGDIIRVGRSLLVFRSA